MSAPRQQTISFRSHVARGEHGEPTPREYEILQAAGAGAMGVVYIARHLALDRVVALKAMGPNVSGDPLAMERFLQEARATSLLRHDNTVQVLDFGGDAGGAWLVMEYLDGKNLADVLDEEGPLAATRAITLAAQVLAGLGAAHDAGIVHRDIKPGNIMLVPSTDDDGTEVELVKVFDFGIATVGAGLPAVRSGEVIGTPDYMSPEQAQGHDVDARSDVYAVGILLYAMLAGDVPFPYESPIETLIAHLKQAPRPLRERVPALSVELETVIMQALAKAPGDRHESARAMRAALLATPEGRGRVSPEPLAPITLAASPRPLSEPVVITSLAEPVAPRRGRGLRWAALALALVGAAGIAVLLGQPTVAAVAPTPGAALARVSAPAAPRIDTAGQPPALAAATPAATPTPSLPPLPTLPTLPTSPEAIPEASPEVSPDVARTKPAEPAVVAKPTKVKAPERKVVKQEPEPPAPKPVHAVAVVAAQPPTPAPEAAPAPAVVAPEVPAQPPAPTVAPAPSYSARAAVGGLTLRGAMPRSSVQRAIEGVRGTLEGCYADAARAASRDVATSASVQFEIDVDGRARAIAVGPLALPGLAACATSALARIRLRDRPDTGTVLASFQVAFTPRAR